MSRCEVSHIETNGENARRSRPALVAVLTTVGLAAGGPAALNPAAHAASFNGPVWVVLGYEFVATQEQMWSFDIHAPPNACGPIPAHGGGTQKATFTTKGKRIEVTSGLNANRKQANFNIDVGSATGRANGVFERRGSFVIENSKRAAECAAPDLTLGTVGCGADRAAVAIQALLTGGRSRSRGPPRDPSPVVTPATRTCPFEFYTADGSGTFSSFNDEDPLTNDLDSGLLGTSTKVSAAQFFKRKKVVLHGGRTIVYKPGPGPKFGFEAKPTIAWTLTLTPRRK